MSNVFDKKILQTLLYLERLHCILSYFNDGLKRGIYLTNAIKKTVVECDLEESTV